MPRIYVPWGDEETQRAQDYAREGLTVAEIAEKLGTGRSPHSIGQHLANVGTPWRVLAMSGQITRPVVARMDLAADMNTPRA